MSADNTDTGGLTVSDSDVQSPSLAAVGGSLRSRLRSEAEDDQRAQREREKKEHDRQWALGLTVKCPQPDCTAGMSWRGSQNGPNFWFCNTHGVQEGPSR